MKKLVKNIVLFLSMFLSTLFPSKAQEIELAVIEDRKLNWNDFEAKVPRKLIMQPLLKQV